MILPVLSLNSGTAGQVSHRCVNKHKTGTKFHAQHTEYTLRTNIQMFTHNTHNGYANEGHVVRGKIV